VGIERAEIERGEIDSLKKREKKKEKTKHDSRRNNKRED
jgi:hypothetical protein